MQQNSKGFNGWTQLAILLGLLGVSIILGGLISIPIWKIMTGGSVLNIEADMLKPQNATAVKVLQAISTFFTLFIPAIAFSKICYKKGFKFLGYNQSVIPKQVLIILIIMLCSMPLISYLQELNKIIPLPSTWRASFDRMEDNYSKQIAVMADVKSWGQYITSLIIIAFLPAVFEETFFRGALQGMLTRWWRSPWAAIIVTSIFFSLIHMSWYGFIARAVLGILLGTIFYYTRSLWLSITAHFINNAVYVTIMFALSQQGKPLDVNTTEPHIPIWAGVISLLIVLMLLISLIRSVPPYTEDLIESIESENPFDNEEA